MKTYSVCCGGSSYRIFPDGEIPVDQVIPWEVIDEGLTLEQAKGECIDQLTTQINAAKDEILDAEDYEG